MRLAIAFIGFGEVGQLFTHQLAAQPGVSVGVYDILFDDPALGRELKRRAARYGARARSERRRCLPRQQHRHFGRDGGCSGRGGARRPRLARPVADLHRPEFRLSNDEAPRRGGGLPPGRRFRRIRRHGAGRRPGHRGPDPGRRIASAEVAATLNPLGMAITPVSPMIGVASATKLCRSIVIKGMEALMVDLNLAAEKAGVLPAVLESLAASYPGLDWADVARIMPARVKQHGLRRAAEMREVSRDDARVRARADRSSRRSPTGMKASRSRRATRSAGRRSRSPSMKPDRCRRALPPILEPFRRRQNAATSSELTGWAV